jgi:hypothetical protein
MWSLGQQHSDIAARIGHDGGINAILRAMDEHPCEQSVQEEACYALCVLAADGANEDRIGAEGGVRAVLGAMRAHRSSKSVQEQAVAALRNLSINEENLGRVGGDGGVDLIVNAMRAWKDDEVLQEHACGALRNLARGNANALRMVKLKATSLILAAMRSYRAVVDLQEEACAALRNMACHEHVCANVATEECISEIVESMHTHRNQGGVQEQACAALSVMAAYDIQAARAMTSAGAACLKAVVDSIRLHTHNPDVQYHACAALCSLAESSHENCAILVGLNGVNVVSEILAAHPADGRIQAAAARALECLSEERNACLTSASASDTRYVELSENTSSRSGQRRSYAHEVRAAASPVPPAAQKGRQPQTVQKLHETSATTNSIADKENTVGLASGAHSTACVGAPRLEAHQDGMGSANMTQALVSRDGTPSSGACIMGSSHGTEMRAPVASKQPFSSATTTGSIKVLDARQNSQPSSTSSNIQNSSDSLDKTDENTTATHANGAIIQKTGSALSAAESVRASDRASARSNSLDPTQAEVLPSVCIKDNDVHQPASLAPPKTNPRPRPVVRQSSLDLLRKAQEKNR